MGIARKLADLLDNDGDVKQENLENVYVDLSGYYTKTQTDGKVVELSPPATQAHVNSLNVDAATLNGIASTSFARKDALTGDLSLGDNVKAKFGAGNDLQIYHDGSNSYVDDAGTGSLFLRGNTTVVLGKYTGERLFDGTADGASRLYYDNSVKLATTSTGIDVTGSVTCDGISTSSHIGYEGTTGNKYIYFPATGNHTGRLSIQAGFGSSQAGGAINLFGHSNTTNPGDVVIGLSNGTGNFSINKQGLATGSELFRVQSNGNVGIGATTDIDSRLHLKTSNAVTTLKLERREVDGILDYGDGIGSILFESNDDTTGASGVRAQIDAIIQNTSGGAYLKFSTANTSSTVSEAMRIIANGNVGIGTNSPSVNLDVYNDSGWGGVDIDGTSGGELQLQKAGTRYGGIYASNTTGLVIEAIAGTNSTSFWTNNTERLRIDSSGNVGIGTSSPSEPLTVVCREAGSDGGIGVWNYNSTRKWNIQTGITGSQNTSFTIKDDTANAVRMTITSSGNVGIGTTSPSEKLEVNGVLQIKRAGDHPALRFVEDSTTRGYIAAGDWAVNGLSNDDFGISSAGTGVLALATGGGVERLRIDSSGKVGIGTTLPGAKLDVSGSVRASDWVIGKIELGTKGEYVTGVAAVPHLYYSMRNPDAGTGAFPFNNYGESIFQTSTRSGYNNGFSWVTGSAVIGSTPVPTVKMRLTEAGNVGIGTSSPAQKLHINGAGFSYLRTTSTSYGGTGFDIGQHTSGSIYLNNRDNTPIILQTNATERMRITSSGNVGIGTSSPNAMLEFGPNTTDNRYDIKSPADKARGIGLGNYTTFSTRYSQWDTLIGTNIRSKIGTSHSGEETASSYTASGGAGLRIGFQDLEFKNYSPAELSGLPVGSDVNSLGTTRFKVNANGNVGIGTASPSTKLHVVGDYGNTLLIGTSPKITVQHSGGTNQFVEIQQSGGASFIGTQNGTNDGELYILGRHTANNQAIFRPNSIELYTAGSERMRIDSSGRVTMPNQPAFRAYLSTEHTADGFFTSGWTEQYDKNNNFNQGIFTAPVSGVYHFDVMWDANGVLSLIDLNANGLWAVRYEPTGSTNSWETHSYSTDFYLNQGDYVKLYGRGASGTNPFHMGGGFWGYFSGHLIG